MPITRQAQATIFLHFMDNIVTDNADKEFAATMAYEGCFTLPDILSIPHGDLGTLHFKDADGDPQPAPRFVRSNVVALQGFVHQRQLDGQPLDDSNWMDVTKEEFDSYRLSDAFIQYSQNVGRPFPTTVPSFASANRPTSSRSPAEEFRRGIKRDPTLFPVLKDEKQWDTWKRNTLAQAHAQNIQLVFDKNYVPPTQEDKDLFKEQQKYVYSIFTLTPLSAPTAPHMKLRRFMQLLLTT